MKTKLFFLTFLAFSCNCLAQHFNIAVYDINDSSIEECFKISNYKDYQKLAVNDSNLLVIVDSNAVFREYDMNNGFRLLDKQFVRKRGNFSGFEIGDMSYVCGNDFIVGYIGGEIDHYEKLNKRMQFSMASCCYYTKTKVNNCKNSGFLYFSIFDSLFGGELTRKNTFIANSKSKYGYSYYKGVSDPFLALPMKRNIKVSIPDFDFNREEQIFAYLTTNNELRSFKIAESDLKKGQKKRSKKQIKELVKGYQQENGLWSNVRYNISDTLIKPDQIIKTFQVVKGDSVIHVLDNGDVYVRHYNTSKIEGPIFNVGKDILRGGLTYIDELDKYLWVHKNKIILSSIKNGKLQIIEELIFDDEIIDYKVSINEKKLAVVTLNHTNKIEETIEIRTKGK